MKALIYKSNETMRYQKSEVSFVENPRAEMNLIKLYPKETRQTIYGFGGAFTEAAAVTVASMSETSKKKVLDAYFSKDGHKYNFCRTHIQSCDFSLGNYAYVEDPEDKELKTFDLKRDHQYLIPFIKDALTLNPSLILVASPWSPPGFMKSNGEMNHGGVLKKEYYQMWADMIVRYLKEYEKLGINVQYLSVQNEPKATQTWDSCLYTGEEEGVFAAEYLRKTLDANGYPHVKIAIWDHNKDCIIERTEETFAVPMARESVAAIAFHWYSGDHFEALQTVKEKYPEKELIFTEGCVEYSRFKTNSQVKNAEMYLHDIIGNLNSGMNAYIDWNLVLNVDGGPNHVGNFCDAPVMYDKETDELDFKLSYYYLGHLSRFVTEGAKRFVVSRCTDKVEAVGFLNPDNSKVLVLMNRTEEDKVLQICEGNKVADIHLEAHSIMTICW
ncbi:glycoside hydrolase family 30 protein [Lachnoclostridium phytofermentans]|uniref:Glycoside hydrolase family 30 n=1 Tax=Lachnoclostridium phytofermentans (strain ATCC 700394 / DSM 18823 / ISDg) TaxID=357809 RepID=A9KTC7_LACP7|nr:glycoside hydrolase family 30 beta sandwich domain-containing protein [Lachnoclostridium phytofermentans]ABX43757.1 glycoside hydrolase family 30 [Lachnoclostridium phytofermentans ISDg]